MSILNVSARALLLAAVGCVAASNGFSQSKEPRFEVVVIKPLGPNRPPVPFNGELVQPGGGFRDPGTTLQEMISEAYDIGDARLKLVGLPKWAEDFGYAVTAKSGPDYPSVGAKENKENVLAMLRSMLADRFHLQIHQEERKAKVLILEVKKGAAELRSVPAPVAPQKEGRIGASISDRAIFLSGKRVSMAQLARSLESWLRQRVEDGTGLNGFYDFDERWEALAREGQPLPPQTLSTDGMSQLASMLDQDLRLVLRPETKPALVWVVDHVEQADEN